MDSLQYERQFRLATTHWWYRATNSLFANLVRRYVPGGSRVLDAGCGTGAMLVILKDDYACTGLDVSELAVDFAVRRGLSDVRTGLVEALPFGAGSFDAVISLDVLYHAEVRSDAGAMAELARVLKPGGHLFIQLPAYEWMRSAHDDKAHSARRYTARRVRELIKGAGLAPVKVGYRMTALFPLAVLKRKVLGLIMGPGGGEGGDSDMRETSAMANRVFGGIMKIENALLRYTAMPFGLSVIAVARKVKR